MVGLTERFEVNPVVIEEALTLTEQSLLVATPQRSFPVRGLSIEDIAELTETRIQIRVGTAPCAWRSGAVTRN